MAAGVGSLGRRGELAGDPQIIEGTARLLLGAVGELMEVGIILMIPQDDPLGPGQMLRRLLELLLGLLKMMIRHRGHARL